MGIPIALKQSQTTLSQTAPVNEFKFGSDYTVPLATRERDAE